MVVVTKEIRHKITLTFGFNAGLATYPDSKTDTLRLLCKKQCILAITSDRNLQYKLPYIGLSNHSISVTYLSRMSHIFSRLSNAELCTGKPISENVNSDV